MNDTKPTFDAKKIGAALGVLAILAVIAVVLYYLPVSKKEEAAAPLKTEYTGLELAQKLEVFLQKSETTPGRYTSAWHCIKSGGCRRSKISARGIWTMPLGYYGLWRATGEEKYKKLADETLERGLKYQCEELKGADCMHYALPAGLLYGYTGDPGYQRFNETLRPFVDAHIDFHEDVSSGLADTHRPHDYFMHAGHILDFFKLTGEDKYRLAASKILEEGKKNLSRVKKSSTDEEPGSLLANCVQFLTSVDFYRILHDKKYLDEANSLIATYRFSENAEIISSAWDMAFCLEGFATLAELTKEKAYKDGAEKIAREVAATFMDHRKNNYTGDFAILSDGGWNEENAKHVGLNLWFMELFATMKEAVFQL